MDLDSLKECVVLYVEDEASAREQTCLILADFVKEVVVAKDGKEGLEKALEREFDVNITDIMMPQLDGIAMVRALREEHHQTTPVIITTAFTETAYLIEAIRLRVEGFITKPLNIKELINALYSAVLPKIQDKKLQGCAHVVEALSALIGGKKIAILRYMIDRRDQNNVFHGAYHEIMEEVGVSKPTVVNMFKQMIAAGILEKVKNKVYRFKQSELIGKEEA